MPSTHVDIPYFCFALSFLSSLFKKFHQSIVHQLPSNTVIAVSVAAMEAQWGHN